MKRFAYILIRRQPILLGLETETRLIKAHDFDDLNVTATREHAYGIWWTVLSSPNAG